MKHSFLLVAGALLLVQFVHALPHMKRESVAAKTQNRIHNSSPSENENRKSAISLKIVGLAQWVHLKGSVVIKNTVEELNEIPLKNQPLRASIRRLSELVEDSEFPIRNNRQTVQNLVGFMNKIDEMIKDYNNMPDNSKLKQTLQTALENNGYKEFASEYEERAFQYAEDVYEALEEYVKDLSPQERVREVKMIQWYEKLQKQFEEYDKAHS
ncbi:uncharacterized protein LOC105218103 [Zeugodacus cucurbitae]|uniref:uncharacterized protein LOC105218103 n=1 Tax=Zeugodacus cucurbitae TaxID=28588 RepID=UPI0023D90C11|nr:uncharacterized protein LOC105218103 [Zeugodacus cucurbitae]